MRKMDERVKSGIRVELFCIDHFLFQLIFSIYLTLSRIRVDTWACKTGGKKIYSERTNRR